MTWNQLFLVVIFMIPLLITSTFDTAGDNRNVDIPDNALPHIQILVKRETSDEEEEEMEIFDFGDDEAMEEDTEAMEEDTEEESREEEDIDESDESDESDEDDGGVCSRADLKYWRRKFPNVPKATTRTFLSQFTKIWENYPISTYDENTGTTKKGLAKKRLLTLPQYIFDRMNRKLSKWKPGKNVYPSNRELRSPEYWKNIYPQLSIDQIIHCIEVTEQYWKRGTDSHYETHGSSQLAETRKFGKKRMGFESILKTHFHYRTWTVHEKRKYTSPYQVHIDEFDKKEQTPEMQYEILKNSYPLFFKYTLYFAVGVPASCGTVPNLFFNRWLLTPRGKACGTIYFYVGTARKGKFCNGMITENGSLIKLKNLGTQVMVIRSYEFKDTDSFRVQHTAFKHEAMILLTAFYRKNQMINPFQVKNQRWILWNKSNIERNKLVEHAAIKPLVSLLQSHEGGEIFNTIYRTAMDESKYPVFSSDRLAEDDEEESAFFPLPFTITAKSGPAIDPFKKCKKTNNLEDEIEEDESGGDEGTSGHNIPWHKEKAVRLEPLEHSILTADHYKAREIEKKAFFKYFERNFKGPYFYYVYFVLGVPLDYLKKNELESVADFGDWMLDEGQKCPRFLMYIGSCALNSVCPPMILPKAPIFNIKELGYLPLLIRKWKFVHATNPYIPQVLAYRYEGLFQLAAKYRENHFGKCNGQDWINQNKVVEKMHVHSYFFKEGETEGLKKFKKLYNIAKNRIKFPIINVEGDGPETEYSNREGERNPTLFGFTFNGEDVRAIYPEQFDAHEDQVDGPQAQAFRSSRIRFSNSSLATLLRKTNSSLSLEGLIMR